MTNEERKAQLVERASRAAIDLQERGHFDAASVTLRFIAAFEQLSPIWEALESGDEGKLAAAVAAWRGTR